MYFLFSKDNLFLKRLNSFDQGGPAARSGTEFTWSPQPAPCQPQPQLRIWPSETEH